MNKIPVALFWSGGKDCSYALFELQKHKKYHVEYLISTINGNYSRLSMHGVKEELINIQALNLGIKLIKFYVHEGTNQEYEQKLSETLIWLRSVGINTVAFGDIFLEDLRKYREEKISKFQMDALFPIWKRNTRELVDEFIRYGFISYTCCVNNEFLSEEWVGRIIDEPFVNELPQSVDPCGENGEFHSFCIDGPIFKKPLLVCPTEKVYHPILNEGKNGFWYCDFNTV